MVSGWLKNWKAPLALGLMLAGVGSMQAGGSNPNELPWGAPNAKSPGYQGDQVELGLLKIEVEPGATAEQATAKTSTVLRLPEPDVVLVEELDPSVDPTSVHTAAKVIVESGEHVTYERNLNGLGIDLSGTFHIEGETKMEIALKGPAAVATIIIGDTAEDGSIATIDSVVNMPVIGGKVPLDEYVAHLRSRGYVGKSAQLVVTQVTPETEGGSVLKSVATCQFQLDASDPISVEIHK